ATLVVGLASGLLAGLAFSPFAYAIYRGRKAPMIANIPPGLWSKTTLFAGVPIIVVGVAAIAATSGDEALLAAVELLLALFVMIGVIAGVVAVARAQERAAADRARRSQ